MVIARVVWLRPVVWFRPRHDPGDWRRDWRPRPGYHPQVDAGGVFTSCAIERSGDETAFEVAQGYAVRLRLLFPDRSRDACSVGSTVRFFDGGRPVGRGTILDIPSCPVLLRRVEPPCGGRRGEKSSATNETR